MDNKQNERVLLWPIGVLLVLFLGLLVVQKSFEVSQLTKPSSAKNTISISGEGKVSAVPDLAQIELGVTTQGSTASDVQNQSTNKINKIIDFVKKQGVPQEDITTSQFSMYPTYDYTNGKNDINGYQANQTISIKIRGVDKSKDQLNKVLGGVTDQGANQINGVTFTFNDPDELRQQAREKAITKAKEKAAELAKISGISLGRLITVSESYGGMPIGMPYAASGMGGGAAMMDSATPNVEPGSQDITATMTVVFEVK